MKVSGLEAAKRLLGFGAIAAGYCLYYVWQAYKAVGASTGMNSPTALDAWNKSGGKHPGDRNPPAGVPVWWGAKASSSAGDVVISLGGGRVAVTEPPGAGLVTGSCTLDERERQVGRPYLGWTEQIFDVPIEFAWVAAPETEVNEAVRAQQEWLNANRGEKLDEDGRRGPLTIAAIERYQEFLGVKVDGEWGPKTQAAHEARLAAVTAAVQNRPNPWSVIKTWSWAGIAAMLRRYASYRGNNTPGPDMVGRLQWWLNKAGYSRRVLGRDLAVDGDFGDNTARVVQGWLKYRPWGYDGEIDAWFGPGTKAAWDKAEHENWLASPQWRQ